MKKLLIAFALTPVVSQAALVIENDAPQASSAPVVAVANTPLRAATAPAVPAPVPAPAAVAHAASGAKALSIRLAPEIQVWQTSPADTNFRLLIAGWARRQGWDFSWEADRDVPVTGRDTYTGTFKDAVRRVLRSTELTNYQLHPCFYSNNLVRVVKLTTVCKPTA